MDESVTFRPTATELMDQVRETLRFYHYAYNESMGVHDSFSMILFYHHVTTIGGNCLIAGVNTGADFGNQF